MLLSLLWNSRKLALIGTGPCTVGSGEADGKHLRRCIWSHGDSTQNLVDAHNIRAHEGDFDMGRAGSLLGVLLYYTNHVAHVRMFQYVCM